MNCLEEFLKWALPTSAVYVAFYRTSYGNEPLYSDVLHDQSLLTVPDQATALQQAETHIKTTSLRKSNGQAYSIWENCKGLVPVYDDCGIGLFLYFYSLKFFAVVFLLLSLIALGQGVLDYDGEYYRASHSDWSAYFPCLGNVKAIPRDIGTSVEDAQIAYNNLMWVKVAQVVVDAVYTCVLLVAIVVYAAKTRAIVERHRNCRPTLADFTVKLTQLPEGRIPEVAAMLESAGIEIHEMVPVRHVNKLLNHLELFDLERKAEVLDTLLKKPISISERQMDSDFAYNVHRKRYVDYSDNINYRLGVLKSQMQEVSGQSADNDIIEKSHSVIIVFETMEGLEKALRHFRKNLLQTWCRKLIVAIQKLMNKERNWVREVSAKWMAVPEEVYWENIKKKQYIIRLFYYYITFLVILISAVIVFLLRGQQNDIDDKTYGDRSQQTKSTSMKAKVQSGSMKFLISLCIIVINVVISWIFNQFITSFEKQSTLPRLKLSAMIKNFVFVLINTSFIILIVNADFSNFKVHYVLRMIDSRFEDYSRDWYLEVGFSILMSMFLGIFSPHALWCLYYRIKHSVFGRFLWLFDTQLAFNHWAVGGNMDLAFKTALQLVAIYGCFMYSGGMPLMLPICCLILVSMFICDSYLLRYLRKPKENSTILHTWLVKLIPGAVVIHCMFSAYMYGADTVFPHVSPMEWLEAQTPGQRFDVMLYINSVRNSYQDRATDYCGKTFLILSGVAILAPFITSLLQRFMQKRGHEMEIRVENILGTDVPGGESYYIFHNRNYKEFYTGLFEDQQRISIKLSSEHPSIEHPLRVKVHDIILEDPNEYAPNVTNEQVDDPSSFCIANYSGDSDIIADWSWGHQSKS